MTLTADLGSDGPSRVTERWSVWEVALYGRRLPRSTVIGMRDGLVSAAAEPVGAPEELVVPVVPVVPVVGGSAMAFQFKAIRAPIVRSRKCRARFILILMCSIDWSGFRGVYVPVETRNFSFFVFGRSELESSRASPLPQLPRRRKCVPHGSPAL